MTFLALCSLNLVCHKVNGVSFQSKNGEMLEYLMGVPLKYKSSVVEIPMVSYIFHNKSNKRFS